jgi:hypothetical protein
MYATSAWHSEGLRWMANVLTHLADYLDRRDNAPGDRASTCPSEACDEARGQARYRVPYY